MKQTNSQEMNIKKKLLDVHLYMLDNKIEVFKELKQTLREKISEGEKQTERSAKKESALLQMKEEYEDVVNRFNEAQEAKDILFQIDPQKITDKIELGSFVRLNSIYLFFSATLPKVVVEDLSVLSLPMTAPLAKLLLDKKLYDIVNYNGSEFTILELQ